MSHQTGIKSNPALRQLMAEAKMRGNQTRLFKVVINTTTEELELATVSGQQPSTLAGAKGTWEADFEATVRKAVTANEPCYLFFRMDSTDDSGHHDWAFILYSPEYSNVRKKMLYASTKSTLKKEFGTGIAFDYFADSEEALAVDAFSAWIKEKRRMAAGGDDDDDDDDQDQDQDGQDHLKEDKDVFSTSAGIISSGQLLSANEEERNKVRQMEYELSQAKGEKKSSQFQFPLRPEAINALLDFRDGRLVYLRLKVNLAAEEIQLADQAAVGQHPVLASTFDLSSGRPEAQQQQQQQQQLKRRLLPTAVLEKTLAPAVLEADDGNVGYHLFTFKHTEFLPGGKGKEGTGRGVENSSSSGSSSNSNSLSRVIFAFVMPTEKTTVRQRIAYSACLNSLIDTVSNRIGLPIDKRIEVDSAEDVTAGYVVSKLFPELDENGVPVSGFGGGSSSGGGFAGQVDVEPAALKFTKPRGPPSRGPRRIIKQ
ncbi:Twinfilin-1 [Tyrophagus putrescentiae]|nr:Twinfilin-1 [Tyrophagus putrescentiae]